MTFHIKEEFAKDGGRTTCVVEGCDNTFITQWKVYGIAHEETFEEHQKKPVFIKREHCSRCAMNDRDMMNRWMIKVIEENKEALVANGNLDPEQFEKRKRMVMNDGR
tara:strand:+ start:336 stop:656 length:321 start_codon:yes stop_codon:yes gene_type:complete